MKRKVFYIIAAVLIVSLGVGMGALLLNTRQKHFQTSCGQLEVSFTDSLKFVSENDVKAFLARNYGDYIGQRLDSVKLAKIEEMLESRSVVMNSEAWTTDDGTLHVSITQRAPILRLMGERDGFYIDAQGYIFPLHKTFTADVPVVSGNVSRDSLFIASMLELEDFLEASQKYSTMAESLEIDGNGELNIRTGRGEEVFVIGAIEELEEKFRKIEQYYAHIVPHAGEGKYRKVIVKYKNQIICREKDI